MKWCVGSDFRPLFGPTGDLKSRERTPDTLSASLNSGTSFDSVSVSFNLPSSTSCMTATEVIGLLIEAMRKMVPSVVGVLFSMS